MSLCIIPLSLMFSLVLCLFPECPKAVSFLNPGGTHLHLKLGFLDQGIEHLVSYSINNGMWETYNKGNLRADLYNLFLH